jgi:hypothetical protein
MQAGAAGGKIEVAEVSDWGSEMQKQGGNVMGKLPADTPKGQPAIPNKVSTIAKKIAKPKGCIYICNRLVSRLNKLTNAQRHISSHCRPDQASHPCFACSTGNDTKRHCRKL